EEPSLPGWMTANEAIEFAAQLSGITGGAAKKRRDEVLEEVGLTSVGQRKIAGFSRGMRQRLGLATALIHDPEVLLLDEPSSALDPGGRRDVLELIQRLRGQRTVLISTHILADVERVCDNVIVVHKGRVVAESSIDELVNKVAPLVAEVDLVGESTTQANEIGAWPWVERVETERLPDRTRVRVFPNDGVVARESLPRVLAKYGTSLLRYEWVSPDLEEVFLAIVGQEEHPPEMGGATA
ncbi:MAG: ABC transporter ATP-binding protein, partial [Dehalococcoidia bacterium]